MSEIVATGQKSCRAENCANGNITQRVQHLAVKSPLCGLHLNAWLRGDFIKGAW